MDSEQEHSAYRCLSRPSELRNGISSERMHTDPVNTEVVVEVLRLHIENRMGILTERLVAK